jgi:cytochrome c oxidase cbb3-type subunit III
MKGNSMYAYVSRCCIAGAVCLAATPVMAQDSARLALGEKVFVSSCKSCHDTGKPQNDAPQLSEKGEWKDRYGKGLADLYKSAIEGFTGYYAMPARGGNAALSDDEVKAAVGYMLQRAGVR